MVTGQTPEAQAGEDKTPATVNTATGEITEIVKRPFSDDELRNLDSIDGIRTLLGDTVASATDLGSGFAVLDTSAKRRLVGVPLVFLFWTFNDGDQGPFVSAHVVQMSPDAKVVGKFIINDGSTGIYAQLAEFTKRTGTSMGLTAPQGLRASDYTYTGEDGKEKPATTFYIDTTPTA